jgi:hypothetical protein
VEECCLQQERRNEFDKDELNLHTHIKGSLDDFFKLQNNYQDTNVDENL